jgi:hypothetical protein
MLRRQQYPVELGELQYVKPVLKKCVSRKERLAQQKKEACGVGKLKAYSVDEMGNSLTKNVGNMMDDASKIVNIYKQHACDPLAPSCLITTKCKAKTSTLHDGTDNVEPSIVGLNLKGDGNVGALYNTYRDIKIVDTEALIQQIRQGYAPFQDMVTKEALYQSQLYGAEFDVMTGVPTGFGCPSACPPRRKVCRKYPPTCKIQDPLNNPIIGIGSDGLEARENLRDVIEARDLNDLRVAPSTAVSNFKIETDLPDDEMEEELTEAVEMQIRRAGKQAEVTPTNPLLQPSPSSEAGGMRALMVKQNAGRPAGFTAKKAQERREHEMEEFDRLLSNNERSKMRQGRVPKTVSASREAKQRRLQGEE